jgi:hypothetical protein
MDGTVILWDVNRLCYIRQLRPYDVQSYHPQNKIHNNNNNNNQHTDHSINEKRQSETVTITRSKNDSKPITSEVSNNDTWSIIHLSAFSRKVNTVLILVFHQQVNHSDNSNYSNFRITAVNIHPFTVCFMHLFFSLFTSLCIDCIQLILNQMIREKWSP